MSAQAEYTIQKNMTKKEKKKATLVAQKQHKAARQFKWDFLKNM